MNNNFNYTVKDSGERSTYPSGAQRDNAEGKGRPELSSAQGLLRVWRWYELGAKKYSDRNWEKGMNISRYCGAAMRHLVKYMWGCDDEDHLAAVMWNCMCIMHHEAERPDMQDLPGWNGRTTKWIYPLDKD
jgi:hypothetical protein